MRARDKLQRGRLRLGRNFSWTIARQMMRLRQHGINHKFTKQEATQTLHMFGRITKRRRKQLYVARTTSYGRTTSQSLMNKRTDVLYPRATHYAANKKNTFPFLFLGYI
jgi:hypothetical protein